MADGWENVRGERFCSGAQSAAASRAAKRDCRTAAGASPVNGRPDRIALLQQCIALDKNYVDAYLSIAGVYAELKDHGQSVRYYEEAIARDSSYTLDYKLPYSINLQRWASLKSPERYQ